jgi:hypothetical protein
MSITAVRQVLTRAIAEPAFRRQLSAAPGQALAGYDLTEEEVEGLVGVRHESYDLVIAALETRVSYALPVPQTPVQPSGF